MLPVATVCTSCCGSSRQSDFNSSRIYKIDMKTGQPTEYYMPLPYEIRDMTVDEGAERPTVWIPTYRAPSKMVKVQIY